MPLDAYQASSQRAWHTCQNNFTNFFHWAYSPHIENACSESEDCILTVSQELPASGADLDICAAVSASTLVCVCVCMRNRIKVPNYRHYFQISYSTRARITMITMTRATTTATATARTRARTRTTTTTTTTTAAAATTTIAEATAGASSDSSDSRNSSDSSNSMNNKTTATSHDQLAPINSLPPRNHNKQILTVYNQQITQEEKHQQRTKILASDKKKRPPHIRTCPTCWFFPFPTSWPPCGRPWPCSHLSSDKVRKAASTSSCRATKVRL